MLHDFFRAVIYYLVPLVLTVLSEGILAAFLRFKKEEQHMLFLINLLTNPLLNMITGTVSLLRGEAVPLVFVLCLEALVVLSEGLLLRRLVPERKHPFLLSLLLNAGSYLFGAALFALFPVL